MARATFGRRTKPPASPGSSEFVERRRHPRERVFSAARLVVDEEAVAMECIIRDISTGGAGLRLAGVIDLPRRFVLEADGGVRRLCRLIWQCEFDAGVVFEATAVG
jgi:hypothetical protein